jgi:hypothetical protein
VGGLLDFADVMGMYIRVGGFSDDLCSLYFP